MNVKKIKDISNFSPESTGLKFRVFVSTEVPRHKPKVKVLDHKGQFSMYISDNPLVAAGNSEIFQAKAIDELKEWIKMNKQALLDYWFDRIDTVELVYKLKRI